MRGVRKGICCLISTANFKTWYRVAYSPKTRAMGASQLVQRYFIFLKTYLFARERERERGHKWEGQRERERDSQADSMLSMEPHMGLDLTTLRS